MHGATMKKFYYFGDIPPHLVAESSPHPHIVRLGGYVKGIVTTVFSFSVRLSTRNTSGPTGRTLVWVFTEMRRDVPVWMKIRHELHMKTTHIHCYYGYCRQHCCG